MKAYSRLAYCILLGLLINFVSCKTNQETLAYTNQIDKVELQKVVEQDLFDHLSVVMTQSFLKACKIKISSDASGISKSVVEDLRSTRQSFYIQSDDQIIRIYSPYQEGRENGVYWFLYELGFRWYFPGDLWKISPKKISRIPSYDKIVTPKFKNRSFNGGGEIPSKHPRDPQNSFNSSWKQWTKRNMFGVEVENKGHTWQDFVKRNHQILLKNPSFLASPLNPSKPDFNTKLCIGNKDLVALFISDREKKYLEIQQRYGEHHLKSQSIGVEPSDGGDHCNCKDCQAIGSISDRVFYLANKVAEHFEKRYPNVKICLLAYNQHSEVPRIRLHENLFVTIVPYRFQHESMPDKFMKDWSQKTKNIQVYDYWGLMIYDRGKPMPNFMSAVSRKLRLLESNGINNLRVETSMGIGPVGIPLYLFSKLAFYDDVSQEELITELLRDCFGDAKTTMKSILNRWSRNGFEEIIERQVLISEFDLALSQAKTKNEKLRIQEFKKYAIFLFQVDELEKAKESEKQSNIELEKLRNYAWHILDSKMIHSYVAASTFTLIYDRANLSKYRKSEKAPSKEDWTNQKYNLNFSASKNRKQENLIKNAVKSGKSESVKKNLASFPTKSAPRSNRILIKPRKSFEIKYNITSSKTIDFEFSSSIVNPKRIGTAFIFGVYDQNENLIWTKSFKGEKKNQKESIKFPKKGLYTLRGKIPNVTLDFYWNDASNLIFTCGQEVKVDNYYYYPTSEQKNILFKTRGLLSAYDKFGNKIEILTIEKGKYLIDLEILKGEYIRFESSLIVEILNSNNCSFFAY